MRTSVNYTWRCLEGSHEQGLHDDSGREDIDPVLPVQIKLKGDVRGRACADVAVDVGALHTGGSLSSILSLRAIGSCFVTDSSVGRIADDTRLSKHTELQYVSRHPADPGQM